jgi:hypothetical protein
LTASAESARITGQGRALPASVSVAPPKKGERAR